MDSLTPEFAASAAAPTLASGRSRTREALRTLRAHPLLAVGLAIATAYVLAGIVAPWVSPYSYSEQNPAATLKAPLAPGHLLGTDEFGRDTLSRLLHGARTSLEVAGGVTAIAMVGGLVLGAIAGYFRGAIDAVIRSAIDLVWSFPNLLVAIILVAILRPGLVPVMIAVGVTNCAGFGRIVRGEALALREREFVRAAVALGRGHSYIILRHIVPNVVAPLFVMASFYMGLAIIIEAAFSFVGLGAQPPTPSWGDMLADGRQYIQLQHWLVTLPGLCIAFVVLGFNLLGDELRDILDPRLKDRV